MHTLNHLVTQARDEEIARAANHPGRLLSHDLRIARRYTRPAPRGRSVLVASSVGLASYVVLSSAFAALT